MTAPAYSTNMTTILLDFSSTTGWTALGGGASGLNAPETDYFIQGNNCITKNAWASAVKGMIYADTSRTIPTDGAVLMWLQHATMNSVDPIASGGGQMLIGNSSSAFYAYYVFGSDTNVFGGWQLCAVDPNLSLQDATVGSPSGTWSDFGARASLTGGPTKGAPWAIDAIRFGRCDMLYEFGETANYTTFLSANTYATNITRRWGLLSFDKGVYLMSGLHVLGTATNAVDFRDSNRNIALRDHPHCSANFNTIEVRNSSSNIDWAGISFKALGTKTIGHWVTTDNATIAFDTVKFEDMGTFSYLSGLTATGCTWLRCGQITAAGSTITSSFINGYTGAADTSALVWNVDTDPDGKLDNTTWTKGTNAHHAIELGTSSPTTMSFTGITSSGFNASNAQNDSFFHVKRTTGNVTINVSGGTGNFSYKTDGATVSIVLDPVTTTITTRDAKTNATIASVRVLVEAADGTGDLPFDTTVTITASGTTASVSHTAHGMANGDKVVIRGTSATQLEYTGVFTISNVSTNAYDYTMGGSPSSPALGTIKATGVVLEGLTNGSGVISASAAYSVSQNVKGHARKSTSAPYYKSNDFSDTINNVTGLTKTLPMSSDQ